MKRKSALGLTLGLGFVAAILLGVGLWAVIYDPFTPACRLPDGTLLRLEDVTYGQQHYVVWGAWWQKLLRPVLPPAQWPREFGFGRPGENRLVFWISFDRLAPRPGDSPERSAFMFAAPELLDEQGDRIGPLNHSRTRLLTGAPGERGLKEEHLDVFPRRGRVVRMRYYVRGRPEPVAEFGTPNPTPGPHPVWTPQPLPITKQSGDLAFTLTALKTDVPRPGSFRPAAVTRATFHVTEAGRPAHDWEPRSVTLSDATGNVLPSQTGDLNLEGDTTQLRFPAALSLNEAAWKLHVEFRRHARSRFLPEEQWTVPGLAVPARDGITRIDRTATRQGVTLRLLGITGRGTTVWPDAGGAIKSSRPVVHVRLSPLANGQKVTLRAIDDRGRVFVGEPRHGRGRRAGFVPFALDLPPDAKWADLTFAVHQSRFVEFLAKPSRL